MNMYQQTPVSEVIEKVVLQNVKRRVEQFINTDSFDIHLHTKQDMASICNEAAISLSYSILKHELQSDKIKWEVTAYKSWWQHFKDTYYPAWLLKHFPVQYENYKFNFEVTYNAVYPKAPAYKGMGPGYTVAKIKCPTV